MEKSVFTYVRKHAAQQIFVILLILLPLFAFQYLKFELPKQIVDGAIDGEPGPRWIYYPSISFDPLPVFEWMPFMEVSQVSFLFLLSGIFLSLVVIVGGLKFVVNTLKGIMAERLLRRLRFELMARVMRFPLPQFRKTSQGEIVTMVTAEVEPLGGFFGNSYVQPIFQGGIFLTTIAFLFAQDFRLGLAAFAAVPLQAWLIPKLQKKVRMLGKERVKNVRALSDRIGETVTGASDLHSNDAVHYNQADMSRRLGKIFDIRYEIYRRKFFMKFINNFINDLTPFFFYSIGGYYVLAGDLSFGALVAGLGAYKDLAAPWKELLNWYQMQADSAVKYDSLAEQFQPSGMLNADRQLDRPADIPSFNGLDYSLQSVTLLDDDGGKTVDNANVVLRPGEPVVITGSSGGGKTELAQALSGLLAVNGGKMMIGEHDIAQTHMSVLGSRIGYTGPESVVFSGLIRDNLHLSLKHKPVEDDSYQPDEHFLTEARASGNSDLPYKVNWVQFDEAGLKDQSDLTRRTMKLIRLLGLEDSFYEMGLQMVVDGGRRPGLSLGIVDARDKVAAKLEEMGASDLIRRFSQDSYNDYASVAENVVYGQPTDATFAFDRLGENAYVRDLLDQHGLKQTFLDIGLKLAHLMVDLFKDVPGGHPFYEQYSFVDADSLPLLTSMVRRHDSGGDDALTQEDKNMLRSLPFFLTPQRHRLGLIDEDMQNRLMDLRHAFRDNMPEDMQDKVLFFNEHGFNPGMNTRSNILFGRIAHGRAHAEDTVGKVISDVLDELELRDAVALSALDFDVGNGGAKLPLARRQLIVLARVMLKRPDILIINESLSALDSAERNRIAGELVKLYEDRILVWIDNEEPEGAGFKHSYAMHGGRLQGVDDAGHGGSDASGDTGEEASNITSEMDSLRNIPLFAGMDRSRLKFLAFASEMVFFMPGETVFRQGDDGDSAYVILKGGGEVWLESDGERSHKLNAVGKNALVGEMALLSDSPRSATFISTDGLDCLKINREVFLELVYQDASISAQITKLMSNRLLTTLQLMN